MANLMKTAVLAGLLAGCASSVLARPPNYKEAKIAPYTLEDPLTFADGRKLATPAEWPARRAEIVEIFAREMYGRTPPKPEAVVAEKTEESLLFDGLGIRRQYRMWFKADKTGPHLDWILFLPNRLTGLAAKKQKGGFVCENAEKSPVVLFLNYRGNHELASDEKVTVPDDTWLRNNKECGITNHLPSAVTRGFQRGTTGVTSFPVEVMLARGYAVLSACYGQVSPDDASEKVAYTRGVFTLWPARDPQATDNITSLGAWAWALSRGLDLAEQIPELDAKKSVCTGCSRLAKAALLACSRDERFAVCVPNQTGGGGVPLAKRDFGENVSTEMKSFPHWYCKAYGKYVDNEQAMKFDQHLLVASIAPRRILVESFNEGWFDGKGEYLSCQAASPAWTFLGKSGMPAQPYPANFSRACIGPYVGYVRRGGPHGLSGQDWVWLMDFADQAFGR